MFGNVILPIIGFAFCSAILAMWIYNDPEAERLRDMKRENERRKRAVEDVERTRHNKIATKTTASSTDNKEHNAQENNKTSLF